MFLKIKKRILAPKWKLCTSDKSKDSSKSKKNPDTEKKDKGSSSHPPLRESELSKQVALLQEQQVSRNAQLDKTLADITTSMRYIQENGRGS